MKTLLLVLLTLTAFSASACKMTERGFQLKIITEIYKKFTGPIGSIDFTSELGTVVVRGKGKIPFQAVFNPVVTSDCTMVLEPSFN